MGWEIKWAETRGLGCREVIYVPWWRERARVKAGRRILVALDPCEACWMDSVGRYRQENQVKTKMAATASIPVIAKGGW
jgi:hypothetical protein